MRYYHSYAYQYQNLEGVMLHHIERILHHFVVKSVPKCVKYMVLKGLVMLAVHFHKLVELKDASLAHLYDV